MPLRVSSYCRNISHEWRKSTSSTSGSGRWRFIIRRHFRYPYPRVDSGITGKNPQWSNCQCFCCVRVDGLWKPRRKHRTTCETWTSFSTACVQIACPKPVTLPCKVHFRVPSIFSSHPGASRQSCSPIHLFTSDSRWRHRNDYYFLKNSFVVVRW